MIIMYTVRTQRLTRPVGVNHRQQQKNGLEQRFVLNNKDMLSSVAEKQFLSTTANNRSVIKMLIFIVIALYEICWFPIYCIKFIHYFNHYFMRSVLLQYAQFISFLCSTVTVLSPTYLFWIQ